MKIENFHDVMAIVEDMYGYFGPGFKPVAVAMHPSMFSTCMRNDTSFNRMAHNQGYQVVNLMTVCGTVRVEHNRATKDDITVETDSGEIFSYKDWFLSRLAEDILLKGKDEDLVDRRSSPEDFPV